MGKKNTTQTHAEILIIAVCVTMSQKKKNTDFNWISYM